MRKEHVLVALCFLKQQNILSKHVSKSDKIVHCMLEQMSHIFAHVHIIDALEMQRKSMPSFVMGMTSTSASQLADVPFPFHSSMLIHPQTNNNDNKKQG